VLNKFFDRFFQQRHFEVPALGLLLTVGMATSATALETLAPLLPAAELSSPSLIAQATISPTKRVPDGIYLYGSSQQPEQIGQEYMVFEARQGKVVGALYMPSSEFSCFSGTVAAQKMNLTVVDPYDQTTNPYSIALQQPSPVASSSGLQTDGSLQLHGYERITNLSNNDQRMLGVCKANFQR
jgi:hypothetical protein